MAITPLVTGMRMQRKTRKAGFTLIEILVVMLIISIVAGVAVLSIGHNENKRVEQFAKDFSQLLMLAEEQAMLQPMVIGVSIAKDHFQFLEWVQVTGRKPYWQVIQDDNILRTHPIPDGVSLNLRSSRQTTSHDGDKPQSVPSIVISINGSITPFSLYVSQEGKQPLYVIEGEADGEIIARRLRD